MIYTSRWQRFTVSFLHLTLWRKHTSATACPRLSIARHAIGCCVSTRITWRMKVWRLLLATWSHLRRSGMYALSRFIIAHGSGDADNTMNSSRCQKPQSACELASPLPPSQALLITQITLRLCREHPLHPQHLPSLQPPRRSIWWPRQRTSSLSSMPSA